MRKSVSDSGSKNFYSSPPPLLPTPLTATTCDSKIGPIDDSFLIHSSSPSECISIPTNYVPSGFIFRNQVLVANHFSQHESKGHVTITLPQSKDESNRESNFGWMFKRRSSKGQDNVKNIPPVKIGNMHRRGDEEIESSKEKKDKSVLENENCINTLPPQCIIASSPFKMSYSSDEIDRLLQMTPEKSRWNKSGKKKRIRESMKEKEELDSGNERKKTSLKESSSISFSNRRNDGGRNDDESVEEERFGKGMNNQEYQLAVTRIPIRFRTRTCSLCLEVRNAAEFHTIWSCGCSFCRPCLSQYLMTCVRDNMNVPFLSCPSADCPKIQFKSAVKSQSTSAMKQVLSLTFTNLIHDSANSGSNFDNKFSRQEIEMLVDEKCFDLYLKLKTEYEVEMDPNRTFCPSVDCENICIISKSMIVTADPASTVQVKSTNSSVMISSLSVSSTLSSLAAASSSAVSSVIKKGQERTHFISKETDAIPVLCNKCDRTFCCRCRKQPFHFGSLCTRPSLEQSLLPPFDSNGDGPEIKRCPRCSIWIEREDGCAQMMCRKCRHVFCWFCLQSLEV